MGSMNIVLPALPALGQAGGVVVLEFRDDGGFEGLPGDMMEQICGLPQVLNCVVIHVVTYFVTLPTQVRDDNGKLVMVETPVESGGGKAVIGLLAGTIVIIIVGVMPQVTQSETELLKVVPAEVAVLLEEMEQPTQ